MSFIRRELKKRAIASPLKSTGEISTEVIENQPLLIQLQLPSEDSIKLPIKKEKFHSDKLKDPLCLPDLNIPVPNGCHVSIHYSNTRTINLTKIELCIQMTYFNIFAFCQTAKNKKIKFLSPFAKPLFAKPYCSHKKRW